MDSFLTRKCLNRLRKTIFFTRKGLNRLGKVRFVYDFKNTTLNVYIFFLLGL